jgi:beta-mannosidase
VFEGLDTYATVKLNDREILKSDNMFVSHRVEVADDYLLRGNNGFGRQRLQISFLPAEQVGNQEVSEYPDHPWCTFSSNVSRLATRKAQYHYVSVSFWSMALMQPSNHVY